VRRIISVLVAMLALLALLSLPALAQGHGPWDNFGNWGYDGPNWGDDGPNWRHDGPNRWDGRRNFHDGYRPAYSKDHYKDFDVKDYVEDYCVPWGPGWLWCWTPWGGYWWPLWR
jgi:hypothetical protein